MAQGNASVSARTPLKTIKAPTIALKSASACIHTKMLKYQDVGERIDN